MSPSDKKSVYKVSDTQVTVKARGPLIQLAEGLSMADVDSHMTSHYVSYLLFTNSIKYSHRVLKLDNDILSTCIILKIQEILIQCMVLLSYPKPYIFLMIM